MTVVVSGFLLRRRLRRTILALAEVVSRTGTVASALRRTVVVGVLFIASAAAVLSQSSGPQPTPMPPPIAAPKDVRYPGTIRLSWDTSVTPAV